MTALAEISRGHANYGLSIRAAVRALWAGVTDIDQFSDQMFAAIRRGLTRAWNDAAEECGISPDELTPEEITARDSAITNEFLFVLRFATFISDNSKANGGLLRVSLERAKKWILRYLDVANQARTMACGDKKLQWRVDPAKEHCSSCLRLHGKVKRGSFWTRAGVLPQRPVNDKLVCKGWQCGCGLFVTTLPVSRGPLPSLP